MDYAQMGACGPVTGCAPGYGPYPYAPFYGGGVVRTDIVGRAPAMVPQSQPQHDARIGSVPQHWDIIGQEGAGSGVVDWLKAPGPLGIKRGYWLGGAAAIGLTWLAYSRGYLGGSSRDFGSDFYF